MSTLDRPGAPGSAATPPDADAETKYALILEAARVLHDGSAETSRTIAATHRLSNALQVESALVPNWNDLVLRVDDGAANGRAASGQTAAKHVSSDQTVREHVRVAVTMPNVVSMNRVTEALNVLDSFGSGKLTVAGAREAIARAAKLPASPVWLFTLACVLGAIALVTLQGAHTWAVLGLVGLGAGVGALVRRWLGRLKVGPLPQLFAAGLIAGLTGVLANRLHLGSALHLAALGPCLVLNPGPPILNGGLDLAAGRVPLGLARFAFAALSFFAIGVGLMLGLATGGLTFLPDNPSVSTSLWLEVLCAGVASGAYGVFFAMPARLLLWPALFGMLIHAIRWTVTTPLHLSAVTGAATACLIVGTLATVLCQRLRLPFAAVGFAAAVSLIPGTILFRMSGGLLEIQKQGAQASPALMGQTLSDLALAVSLILALTVGFVIPRHLYARLYRETDQTTR